MNSNIILDFKIIPPQLGSFKLLVKILKMSVDELILQTTYDSNRFTCKVRLNDVMNLKKK